MIINSRPQEAVKRPETATSAEQFPLCSTKRSNQATLQKMLVCKKKLPPCRAQGGVKKKRSRALMVLGALFLDEFDEQFQVFRLHIGQNTVAEIENMAGMFGMLTK